MMPDVSPYLNLPLRTIEQARLDRYLSDPDWGHDNGFRHSELLWNARCARWDCITRPQRLAHKYALIDPSDYGPDEVARRAKYQLKEMGEIND